MLHCFALNVSSPSCNFTFNCRSVFGHLRTKLLSAYQVKRRTIHALNSTIRLGTCRARRLILALASSIELVEKLGRDREGGGVRSNTDVKSLRPSLEEKH